MVGGDWIRCWKVLDDVLLLGTALSSYGTLPNVVVPWGVEASIRTQVLVTKSRPDERFRSPCQKCPTENPNCRVHSQPTTDHSSQP